MSEKYQQLNLGLGHANRVEPVGQITMFQLLDLHERRQASLETRRRALESKTKQGQTVQVFVDGCIQAVARDYSLERDDIVGPSRRADVAEARHLAAHIIYSNTDLGLKAVARILGRRDHTTILNSLERVRERMEFDPDFRMRAEELTSEIPGALA